MSVASTSLVASNTTKSDIRARARQIVLRLESDDDNVNNNSDVGWRLGATRLDVRNDGRR